MKYIITIILAIIACFFQVTGQSFKKEFDKLASDNDTAAMRQLLEKWDASESKDPELYTSYFNYYYMISKNEMITIGQEPKGEYLEIKDKDSSNEKPAAYLYGDTYYDFDLITKAFDWIDCGIEEFPNRLEMRFGKVYLLGKLEKYDEFSSEIIKAVDYSAINKNNWQWTNGKPLDDPKQFMLSTIQSYQLQIYNTENDDLLIYMTQIAESVLKHYPDHVESLSNLAIVSLIKQDYDKALESLLRAEKINPEDAIVLNNIAHAYKQKGDKKKAIKYYEQTIKYGNGAVKESAKTQLELLKRK